MESRVLAGLAPERVFRFFEDLCSIPHGSGNTKAVSDYCAAFARERGLRCLQDASNNIVIFQDGTPGYADHPTVILQGHLDMVCAKAPDVQFDFTRDPLRLKVEDGCVTASGTTLGGDDGIAVAMALAILDDPSIPHPPLEAVFTVDEEVGLIGAAAMDCTPLQGRRLINIDSEAEGVLTVSCAGGLRSDLVLPAVAGHGCGVLCTLTLSGFSGGHSGAEIHLGRGNADVLMGEILQLLSRKYSLQLQSLEGGKQDNAIPAHARSSFLLPADQAGQAQAEAAVWWAEVRPRFAGTDPDCAMDFQICGEVCGTAFSPEDSRKMADLIAAIPNGVQAMSQEIPGLVETSMNLGILLLEGDGLHLTVSVRSNSNGEKEAVRRRLAGIAGQFGADFSTRGEYPAWEYRKDSPLRSVMAEAFTALYGRSPAVEAIHAGLECGLFSEKLPGLDCVSIGPDILDIHTPRERLPIDSVQRTWAYLLAALRAL